MRTTTIHTNVYFVGLYLPYARSRSPKVTLKRITGYAGKNIDQSVIPEYGQQCLLVIKGVLGDHSRC